MLRVLQISDLHILLNCDETLLGINTAQTFEQVMAHAAQYNRFDCVLATGDLAQQPCLASYRRIFDKLQAYPVPVRCLPGNHDDLDLMQQVFNTETLSCNKHSVFGCWQMILLNSHKDDDAGGHLVQAELDFLATVLAAHPEHFALVAVHHPCLPCGSAWLDEIGLDNGDELMRLIKTYPQVKVLCFGHIHQVFEAWQDGIFIGSAPSTCFQFAQHSPNFGVDLNAPGYRIFELHDDGRVVSEVFRIAGQIEGLETDHDGY